MATAFQKAVWEAVSTIPEGEVRTYGEVAEMAGYPNAHQGIGPALEAIPWWRIIKSDGTLANHSDRDRQIVRLLEEGWSIHAGGYPPYIIPSEKTKNSN